LATSESAAPARAPVVSPGDARRYRRDVSDSEQTDEPVGGERVRFCLGCGQIVAYAQRTCPSCGHVDAPGDAPGDAPRVPCRACGQPKLERLLHCPACGAEAAPPRLPSAARWTSPPAGAGETLSVALALLAPLAVLLALLHVVLDAVA
jgi:hypothetical protein